MNSLFDVLLWTTIACIVLTFVFVAMAVVMLLVTVLWLEIRAVFCGPSQDSGRDEITLLSSLVLLGLSMREAFNGWSGD